MTSQTGNSACRESVASSESTAVSLIEIMSDARFF